MLRPRPSIRYKAHRKHVAIGRFPTFSSRWSQKYSIDALDPYMLHHVCSVPLYRLATAKRTWPGWPDAGATFRLDITAIAKRRRGGAAAAEPLASFSPCVKVGENSSGNRDTYEATQQRRTGLRVLPHERKSRKQGRRGGGEEGDGEGMRKLAWL